MNGKVLGLDIGIGSCGWALIDFDNEVIIDMGAHLWDPPQEDKTKVSLAATRRSARSARRNTKRTADRKKHCLNLLKKYGLAPVDASKQWIQTKKGDLQPLEARSLGLDRKLSERDFAQVLYSLCSRRGYIPHGEGSDPDDKDAGRVLKAISANEKIMDAKGYRTVGEMLYKEGLAQGHSAGSSRNKDGDYQHCITCEQIVAEAHTLFEVQSSLGSTFASSDFEREYIEVLSWEKEDPDYDARVYGLVGTCTYFKDEPRAAKACLSFELCNAMERLAHVVYVMPDGRELKLPAETRRKFLGILFSVAPIKGNKDCKVRYSDIAKELDLPAGAYFKDVDGDKLKTTEVYKPLVWRKMRGMLPGELMQKLVDDRGLADSIGSALAYASTADSLMRQLDGLPLSAEEKEAICKLPYNTKLFSGYGMRSLKALGLLIDAFEDSEDLVTTLSEAEDAAGLRAYRLAGETQKGMKLPPYILYDKTCKNPVVLRVMARVRKLVNAVIREYGMPDQIHIELARELKHSEKEKTSIRNANNARKDRRETAEKRLAEDLGCSPEEVPSRLIRKYLLWDEQGNNDLYLDEPIHYERMIRDDTYCQIDHILPYSRTCDDSQNNKILVLAKSNQDKKERSPYEWLSEEGTWDEFEKRIKDLARNGYPKKKRDKLLEKDLASKETKFIERNLNDTRYATRAALGFITDYLAFEEDGKRHTFALAGGATSALRTAWGFTRKDREKDDCHHAVDAAIIAACDSSAVQKIARASEKKHRVPKEERKALFAVTEPWEGFAMQVEQRASSLIPTRMVDHGGTGRLYEDTVYAYCGLNEGKTKGILRAKGKESASSNYVVREDGAAMKPDGMAFLRLWWDESLKVRGKKELGGYLMEPVYYADLAALASGDYVPRYVPPQTSKRPRCEWPMLSEGVLSTSPLVLRYGDCVELNGERFRFCGVGISACSWELREMRNFASDATKGHALATAKQKDSLKRIDEDILGLCHKS